WIKNGTLTIHLQLHNTSIHIFPSVLNSNKVFNRLVAIVYCCLIRPAKFKALTNDLSKSPAVVCPRKADYHLPQYGMKYSSHSSGAELRVYKDLGKFRNHAWEKLGLILAVTGGEAKDKWNYLRENFGAK
uniref:Uncharacterized protein n=1 Tax=Romanomermis culicivorax TaxID=13658 RepID=A0A915KAY5_ROMCU